MRHVLWDWNGTLLDDTEACLVALNEMLARRGRPSITLSFYRRTFAFPVRAFYEKIGIRLADEDWDALAREYHDAYLAQRFGLNAQAREAMALVAAAGARQSILSALRQDLLDEATVRFGVRGRCVRVCGSDNLNGASKLARARALVAELRAEEAAAGESPSAFVMIGDSLHDAEVAREIGASCVLFSGGGHSEDRLAAVAPVSDSLVACAQMALDREGEGARCPVVI